MQAPISFAAHRYCAALVPLIPPLMNIASAIPCGLCERLTDDPRCGQLFWSAHKPKRTWWTGEDSNLRSPQGAADLQSAGFSHSPTRPANSFGTLDHVPQKIFGTQLHRPAQTTRTRLDISTGNIAMQKGLVSEDTSPSAFVARNPSATLPKSQSLKTQLAEGVEPPTL